MTQVRTELLPVLVTGSNRSGTTWVGRMLCQSGELAYIHEPFNPGIWPRKIRTRLEGHYTYVSEANERSFLEPVRDLLAFRPPLLSQMRDVRAPSDFARLVRDEAIAVGHRLRRRRPLLKDPIAIFAAPWLARRFDMRVVVMIRHPAAYVSSVQRLGWEFDFAGLLRQEHLIDDLLGEHRAEIEHFALHRPPPFDQAILLWKLLYGPVARWRTEHPNWEFHRHEDLSAEPVAGFQRIYETLGLRWDDEVVRRIASSNSSANPSDRPVEQFRDIRRNSVAAGRAWRSRLSSDEIARVRRGVGHLADRFYEPWEWPEATAT